MDDLTKKNLTTQTECMERDLVLLQKAIDENKTDSINLEIKILRKHLTYIEEVVAVKIASRDDGQVKNEK